MSVQEIDTVDYIYLEEAPGRVVSDPLGWTPSETGKHIALLTDKLHTQVAFVRSGRIVEMWPDFHDGERVWVEVAARCALSPRAEAFYDGARDALAEANIGLRVVLLS